MVAVHVCINSKKSFKELFDQWFKVFGKWYTCEVIVFVRNKGGKEASKVLVDR